MYKLIGVVLLLLSSCTYWNDKHYNDIVNIESNFNQLEEKDRQMNQDLEAVKAAAQKRSQGENR